MISLAEAEKTFFNSSVRRHGQEYFLKGRVSLVVDNDEGARANVRSSDGNIYEVKLWWDDEGDLEVFDCECPYSEDHDYCKHLWATILKLDEMRGIGGTQRSADKARKTQNNESAAQPQPAWLQHLRNARQSSTASSWSGGVAAEPGLKMSATDQFWYVIDVAWSMRNKTIFVNLLIQQERANGTPGAIKEFKLNRKRLREIADPQHAAVMQELLACTETSSAFDDYRYSAYDDRSYSHIGLRPLVQKLLLPKIAETGRLCWKLSNNASMEDAKFVTWDGDRPWLASVKFQEDSATQEWVVTADLTRESLSADDAPQTETRSLADVVYLDGSGTVLFSDTVAQIDFRDTEGWLRLLQQTSSIRIPFDDREKFLKQLTQTPELHGIALPQQLTREQPGIVCQPGVRLLAPDAVPHRMRHMKFVFGALEFVYGDTVVPLRQRQKLLWDNETSCLLTRDTATESSYLRQLSELGVRPLAQDYSADEIDIKIPQDQMPVIVRQLMETGWIVEAAGVKLKRPGSFHIGVTSGQDWFELNVAVEFEGAEASLPDLLQAVRKGDNFVRLSDGSQGMLPEEWLSRYSVLAGMGDVVGDAVRFRPSQAMILDALLDAQDHATRDRDFTSFCRKLKTFSGIKPRTAPRTFRGDLRDYQKEGLGWLHFLREFHLGGCLADDMGLGKTIQVLALLENRRTQQAKSKAKRKPSLVVVPKSLVFNWIEEASRFVPKLAMLNYTGLDRHERLSTEGDSADVMVTTYGTLRNDILPLKEMEFDYVVLDEAQAIKNAASQSAKASRLLQCDHRLAMTGTPVENHLGELWSLFEFLNPGMLGSSAMFQKLTAATNDEASRATALDTLSRALRPFMLRRTKAQVLTELPGKTEQTITCELPPKQRRMYNELRDYYRLQLSAKVEELGVNKAKIHVLEALLRLRQVACHPGLVDKTKASEGSAKLDTIVEQLRQLADEGHKALVFSQFTTLLALLKPRLDKEGIRYEYLDGKTRNRQERVNHFQNDESCSLFLISLKAGGHGLNLTAADYVFILDPWWNPAVEAQAVDRAHRMGQDRHVFAYRLISKDTVEERILQLQKEKKQLADAIVSADASLIKSLTADDLQLLLS